MILVHSLKDHNKHKFKLLENKLIGVRETHRLVITIQPEVWRMGKVLKKI